MVKISDVAIFHPGLNWQALANQYGTPSLVLDCDILRQQYRRLSEALPDVALYYAIKAFPNADVIRTLRDEGACFDIASNGEIELLREVGVAPRSTIHTHPIKKDRDVRAALRFGCTTFVVDNAAEIAKFVPYRRRVALLLRVSFRSPDARCDLSRKFGCAPEEADALLDRAAGLGLHVKGLSFHVGSQSGSPDAHVQAIEACVQLMEHQRRLRRPMSVLDIGGGFPSNYEGTTPAIDLFCAPIRAVLARLPAHVRVIAEPGRYLVAPAATSITSVVGKAVRDGKRWYYLDDGVYGAFSGQIYDHTRYPIGVLRSGKAVPSVLAGPTCDSIDVIAEDIALPELEIGDLVIASMMGAYTIASASEFNSLPKPKVIAINAPAVTQATVTYLA
jgi:ornithine decarboxylase